MSESSYPIPGHPMTWVSLPEPGVPSAATIDGEVSIEGLEWLLCEMKRRRDHLAYMTSEELAAHAGDQQPPPAAANAQEGENT